MLEVDVCPHMLFFISLHRVGHDSYSVFVSHYYASTCHQIHVIRTTILEGRSGNHGSYRSHLRWFGNWTLGGMDCHSKCRDNIRLRGEEISQL